MKKALLLQALMLVELMTPVTFAATTTSEGNWAELCQAPYKTVCGESQQETQRRTQHIRRIEESLKKPALEAAFKYLFGNTDFPTDFDETRLRNINPKAKRKAAIKIFLSELRTQLRKYMTDNKIPSDLQVPAIKDSLIKAIQNSTEIPEPLKNTMQETVRQTRVISITEVNSELLENTSRDVIEMYHGCSSNMFMDNAFATDLGKNGKSKVVIVCPGEIIGSVEFAKEEGLPSGYEAGPLIMTLGHELGHHFDFTVYPEAYPGLLQRLNKSDSYGAEITADIWGLKTFVIATSRINSVYKNILARGALNDLCGTPDDGEHPDGAFRMNVLAANYLCK